jgi:hypothetical protein
VVVLAPFLIPLVTLQEGMQQQQDINAHSTVLYRGCSQETGEE